MSNDTSKSAGEGRPLVSAIHLPWSVSVSEANLAINWIEGGQCVVLCDAFFGLHHAVPRYKRVAVRFKRCVSAVVQMRRDDSEVVGGDRYDWSEVRTPRVKTESELTDWLTAFATDWSASGICPNPNFFQVDGSDWAARFHREYRHFIIEGTDSHIEVLAREFDWVVESDLPE